MYTTSCGRNSIVLIGMPGAGKSTIGVILAKLTGLRFLDTDLDIQCQQQATLQEIIEARGHLALRAIEEQVLLELPLERAVVSTGGSAVYSEEAMRRLRRAGPTVYLRVSLPLLEQRVAATPDRGIASASAQSFAEVFSERTPLYEHYADHTVDADAGTADEVAAAILALL